MRLESLQLKYFRQHQNTHVRFNTGLTAIIGPNGAGKTTLVEAIAFALYGTKVIRGKLEYLSTRLTGNQAKLEVTLTFVQAGQVFKVVRGLHKASIYVANSEAPIATGVREVAQKVTEILRMTHDEFTSTYFTEQKGLEFLAGTKGASERERFIVRMLGYDRIEKAQDLIRFSKRDAKSELSGAERQLISKEDLLVRIENETMAYEAAKEKLAEAKRVLDQAKAESEKEAELVKRIGKKRKDWEMLNRQKQNLAGQISTYQITLKGISAKLVEAAKGVVDLSLGAVDFSKEFEGLREEYQYAKSELETMSALYTERELELRGSLLENEILGDSLVGKRKSLDEVLQEANHKLIEIDKDGDSSECPLCGQTLLDHRDKARGHIQNEVDRLTLELNDIGSSIELQKAEAGRLGDQETELRELKKTLLKREEFVLGLRKKIDALEKVVEFKSSLIEIEKSREAALLEESKIDADLISLGFDPQAFEAAENLLKAKKSLEEVSRLQLTKVQGQLDGSEAMLSRSKLDLDSFEKNMEKLGALKEQLALLEESDLLLTNFRKYVNSMIRPRLAELASDYFIELTDGRYTNIELSEDFSPVLIEDGEEKPVISGGEEDILNLSVRLALSTLLAERAGHGFSLLVLDEVFGALDGNRRQNVLDLLERLGSRFEQIILITHIDDIKDAVQNLVYVDFDDIKGEVTVSEESTEDAGIAANI